MSKLRVVVHRDPWAGPFTVVYRDGEIIPGVFNCDVSENKILGGFDVRLGFLARDDMRFHVSEVVSERSDQLPPADALDL